MNRPLKTLTVLFFICIPVITSADNSSELRQNKQELQTIKNQLDETHNKVDSLKQLETQIQKEIANYGDRVSRNKRLVVRLQDQLKQVRSALSENGDLLQETEIQLADRRKLYSRMLIDYYHRQKDLDAFQPWDFDGQLLRKRMQHYLAALSGQTSNEIGQVGDSVAILSQYIDSLAQAGIDLDKLQREKKARIDLDLTLKNKEETSLGSVRRQSNILQDRLVSLSAAAREMEDIIAHLEMTQRQRRKSEGIPLRFQEGSFSQLKGHLAPPIRGKVVKSFGWKTDPITNLKSFSPGIDIKPHNDQRYIMACAPGRVAYVGQMRGYAEFVILEHDDGYYTTYAGMASSLVELDDLVDVGEKIGTKGNESFHFELRKGREHLDPVIWLDIDAI